jgi:DNA-binding NarL/FixJ family response regulator
MAGKIINMSKVKQVLRLHTQGVSNRRIALDLGLYKGTVNSYIRKIKDHV